MIGYALHPEARFDLDEIWEFIRADNLDAADRMIAEILAAVAALVPSPAQGHRRPDLTSRPLRFTLVREYLIAYAPDEEPLWVVAIMHGRRSPRVMAAILRGRESGLDRRFAVFSAVGCFIAYLGHIPSWRRQSSRDLRKIVQFRLTSFPQVFHQADRFSTGFAPPGFSHTRAGMRLIDVEYYVV